jgi:putative ATP-dependent endonuclease of OLD family
MAESRPHESPPKRQFPVLLQLRRSHGRGQQPSAIAVLARGAMTTVDLASSNPTTFAALYVELVRIHNFRGLNACEVELEPTLTLLVGRNNAGKSRVLRALALALGGLPADIDDLTVGSQAPALIDVVVAPKPTPTAQTDEEVFETAIGQRLGSGVQVVREEPLRERFAWRTTVRRSAEGLGARAETQVLVFDAAQSDWVLAQNASGLSRDQRLLFAVDLVEARRDLVEELARRGSAIRRVLSDLEVDDATRVDLEDQLAVLSGEIVDKSATLEAVRRSLASLEALVGSIGTPALNPLPVRLEELARSVAIDFDTGGGSLPVRFHGAGARSLASLQVQGVLYDRRLGHDGPALRPHPLTLVEEPEAHLHPQASQDLAGLLITLPGQVVASTHSSHLVTAVDPRGIRLIRHQLGKSTVIDLGPARSENSTTHRALRVSTHATEMEKLKRLVERPFGELLFASAIVIGDGATERAFLPIVIRHALGTKAHGVCVIDPESMKSDLARAAVKFAKLVGIPWLLFSDTDGPGKADAQALIAEYAEGNEAQVVWVVSDTAEGSTEGGAIERMLIDFDEQLCKDACLEVRPDLAATGTALQLLGSLKGSIGPALARKLIDRYGACEKWPSSLRTLVTRLDAAL